MLTQLPTSGFPKVCKGDLQFGRGGEVSCACGVCRAWRAYVQGRLFGRRVYEVLTLDLVKSLARHIRSRQVRGERTVVLEVGAGNGALGHHIREALLRPSTGGGLDVDGDFEVVCTDSGAR